MVPAVDLLRLAQLLAAPHAQLAAKRCGRLVVSLQLRQQRLGRRPQPVAGAAKGHGGARVEHVARLLEDELKELIGQGDHCRGLRQSVLGGRRQLHRKPAHALTVAAVAGRVGGETATSLLARMQTCLLYRVRIRIHSVLCPPVPFPTPGRFKASSVIQAPIKTVINTSLKS